jgi:hypothetical protein
MAEKEYILFCDESDRVGRYYSNFYGGLIVAASQYEKVTKRLNAVKQELNLHGEVKWEKVTERYLPKYENFIKQFFQEIAEKTVKVRIMFRQNAHKPTRLTEEQIEGEYFLLYYQFIKHAFGLEFIEPTDTGTNIRLYFDEFPETREKVERFKGFLLALQKSRKLQAAKVVLTKDNLTEVRSHDHVLLQGLDIVLGAMSFRLNDKHKEVPPGKKRRGKRTRAKESLYKLILAEVRELRPGFNIGVTTSLGGNPKGRWESPYLHWAFTPHDFTFEFELTKRGQKAKK